MTQPQLDPTTGVRALFNALVVAVFLLAPLGCGDEKTTQPPPARYLPQSSVANVMENLRRAYVDRDLEAYQKLFADDFMFVFNPRDVAGENSTLRSWGRAEELGSAEELFSSEFVDQIELDYSLDTTAVGDTLHEGTMKLFATNIRLTVHTRTGDGESMRLEVPGDVNTFYLREYPEEKASDGKNLWRIVCWHDTPNAAAKGMANETTWGAIKWLGLCSFCSQNPNNSCCKDVNCN